MGIAKYSQHLNVHKTPQVDPIPGSSQVPNSAGGYSWQVDCWKQLDRFLILGSEGGTYYISEKQLTKENTQSVLECLRKDGIRTVNRIMEISLAGRAPKNDPAIFALALAISFGDASTKAAAYQALNSVCRIGTHLFHFAQYVNDMRGWGSGLRRAIANWYLSKTPEALANQVVKYKQRDGWSHFDLLRLVHPTTENPSIEAIFRWVAQKPLEQFKVSKNVGTRQSPSFKEIVRPDVSQHLPAIIKTSDSLTATSPVAEVIDAIRKYNLTHEMIPTEFKDNPDVWVALLDRMPMTALIRNLGNMTRIGTLAPLNEEVSQIVARLNSEEELQRARIHPLQVLIALKTYAQGRGERGGNTWNPIPQIVDALNAAFYKSFKFVEPTGKSYLLGIDVSGSMGCSTVAGASILTARVGAAAMALATAKVEKNYHILGFSHELRPLNIGASSRLDDAIKTMEAMPMGGTDCALPIVWALRNKVNVDVFSVYTDSETWYGEIHPSQALKEYRKQINPNAKLVVVGMCGNKFSIADPKDAGMLDVVGFDSAVPQIISSFALGNI